MPILDEERAQTTLFVKRAVAVGLRAIVRRDIEGLANLQVLGEVLNEPRSVG